jgi:ankyrin repeat protein
MLTGNKDTDREVLRHLDDRDLLKVCHVSKNLWNKVCDDDFLRRRLTEKYPGIEKYKKEGESWKDFFLKALFYIGKMKEEFKFEYTFGDFKKQYYLLKENNSSVYGLFFEAVKNGELPLVIRAIQHGANEKDTLALIFAVRNGHLEIVNFLNENGANIHYRNDDILREASENGYVEIVKYLIEKGANVHTQNDITIKTAAQNGHLNVIKYLVETGYIHSDNDAALRTASEHGYLDIVKYLVENGADIHAENEEALRYSSQNGHFDVVKYLVENGANVHAQNNKAFKFATKAGHTDIAKYLGSFKRGRK